MVDGKHALVVVACVAGIGASAGFEQTVHGASTYAKELFGKATNLTYPLNDSTTENLTDRVEPMVVLTLKNQPQAVAADSKATVKFELSKATFAEAVLPGDLVCRTSSDTGASWDTSCSETTITIADGGAKDSSSVTFEVMAGETIAIDPGTATADGANQARLELTVPQLKATGAVTVATSVATSAGDIPPVVNPCPTAPVAAADACNKVVKTAEAVMATVAGGGVQAHIHLDDFKMLAPMADGKARESVSLGSYTFNVDNKGGSILGPDGEALNEDAAATLTIAVEGDLNEGDVVTVGGADPKSQTVAASGEGVSMLVTLSSAEPGLTALKSSKKVDLMYMPAGKERLSHGAEIDVHFMPRFTRVENTPIPPAMRPTTLKLSGVGSEVRAYALPHADNGKMDRANVRVRCENGTGKDNDCRVFVECWDDMGMGDIGEVGKIVEGALKTLDSEKIEMYSGVDPDDSRLSCRVLATGMVAVQSLVRDGTTGTLVNNTYIAE